MKIMVKDGQDEMFRWRTDCNEHLIRNSKNIYILWLINEVKYKYFK